MLKSVIFKSLVTMRRHCTTEWQAVQAQLGNQLAYDCKEFVTKKACTCSSAGLPQTQLAPSCLSRPLTGGRSLTEPSCEPSPLSGQEPSTFLTWVSFWTLLHYTPILHCSGCVSATTTRNWHLLHANSKIACCCPVGWLLKEGICIAAACEWHLHALL